MPETVKPPRWATVSFLVVALLISAWLMLNVNTSSAVRECRARYRQARTAADSAQVDLIIPAHDSADRETNTCAFIRGSARWR